MDFSDWVFFAVCGVVLVVSVIISIVSLIKKNRAQGKATTIGEIFNVIMQTLLPAMEQADTTDMTAQSKKTFVKSQVMLACNSAGIGYDDKLIDDITERFVAFSKRVNGRIKDIGTESDAIDGSGESAEPERTDAAV